MRKNNFQVGVLCIILLILPTLIAADKQISRTIALYGSETYTVPFYRIYNGTLGPQQSAIDVASNARWVMSSSSKTRTEVLLLTLDNPGGNSDTVSFQVWNGSNWTNFALLGSDSDKDYKGIDIKHFADDANALIVYTDNDKPTPFSRVWNGTNVSNEITAPNVGATVRITTLATHPQDAVAVLLTEDADNDINFQVWNGSNWTHQVELEDDSWNNYEPMGIAYEQLNNRSVVLWSDNDEDTPYYRVWNGTNLSIEYTGPNVGGSPRFFALASKPRSNEIVASIVDDASDTNIIIWNGTGWSSPTEITTSGRNNRKSTDVVYEQLSGYAVVVYDDGTNTPKYRVWNGSAWSSGSSVGNVGHEPTWLKLAADNYSNNLSLIVQDDNGDITFFLWNSTSWTNLGEVLSNDASDAARQMSLEYEFGIDKSPNVTLISPPDSNSSTNRNLTFIANITDDLGLMNATLYVNTTGIFAANQTATIRGITNATTFNLTNLQPATYVWNILACDSNNQCSFAAQNFTVTVTEVTNDPPNVTLLSPPNVNVSQNKDISFIANITDDLGLRNVTFYVNSTGTFSANQSATITGTSNSSIFNLSDLLPATYLWNILACDTTNQCSFAIQNFTVTVTAAQGSPSPQQTPSPSSSSSPGSVFSEADSGFDKAALRAQSQREAAPTAAKPAQPGVTGIVESPSSSKETQAPAESPAEAITGPEVLTGSFVKQLARSKSYWWLLLLLVLIVLLILKKQSMHELLKKIKKRRYAAHDLRSKWKIKHDDYSERLAKMGDQKKSVFPELLKDVRETELQAYKPAQGEEKKLQLVVYEGQLAEKPLGQRLEFVPTRKVNKEDSAKTTIMKGLKGVYKIG